MRAKAITEVLKKCEPARVAVDKFGKEEFVLRNLDEKTKAKVIFMTDGGRDAAIAAASIAARMKFLQTTASSFLAGWACRRPEVPRTL